MKSNAELAPVGDETAKPTATPENVKESVTGASTDSLPERDGRSGEMFFLDGSGRRGCQALGFVAPGIPGKRSALCAQQHPAGFRQLHFTLFGDQRNLTIGLATPGVLNHEVFVAVQPACIRGEYPHGLDGIGAFN